jgi:hypothetical protein
VIRTFFAAAGQPPGSMCLAQTLPKIPVCRSHSRGAADQFIVVFENTRKSFATYATYAAGGNCLKYLISLVPGERIEPPTNGLQKRCLGPEQSQAVLLRPDLIGLSHSAVPPDPSVCHPVPNNSVANSVATELGHGAGIAGIYNRATYAKEIPRGARAVGEARRYSHQLTRRY